MSGAGEGGVGGHERIGFDNGGCDKKSFWPFGDGKWPTFFLLGLLAMENSRLFSCLAFWRRKKCGETLGVSLVVPEPAVPETNRRVEGPHPSCKERD